MKTLHTAGLMVLALAVSFAPHIAIAADPPQQASGFAPLAPGEREHLLDDAKARHARAQALRSEAADEFRRAEAACYDRIMVSGCIGDAKKERLRKTLEARQLDLGADRLQREVKLRENALREAQGAEKAPEGEAAAARNSEEAQNRAAEQAKREAERERELQEAPARAAAEAANRQRAADEAAQRQAAEAKRASKRAESAARQRAEIDHKAAEHARRRAEAQAAAEAKAAAENPAGTTSAPR